MPLAQRTELEQAVERFIANSSIDSRAIASLRAQDPEVQRAVLDRGELSDCQNPSAALMGRIQVAKDHVNFERTGLSRGSQPRPAAGPAGPLPLTDVSMQASVPAPVVSVAPSIPPEVEEFIRENRLDDSAARTLRDADKAIQKSVLNLGNFKNCRNPSAVCLARIREARIAPVTSPEDRPQAQAAEGGGKKSELEVELDKFLEESDVDSRAASALRAQTPEVQRAVLDRGELTDCQNPSTALMGRIRVAHENLAFERKRAMAPAGTDAGVSTTTSPKEPPAASPEVEEFIRDNKIDGLAARQLREADQETQEDVVARGSLSDCRNPSAVCLARIRDSKSMAMARLEPKTSEPAASSSNASAQTQTLAGMMLPVVPVPMANMMMMANLQASMAGMMPMTNMMPMANVMMLASMGAMGSCGYPMATVPMSSMGTMTPLMSPVTTVGAPTAGTVPAVDPTATVLAAGSGLCGGQLASVPAIYGAVAAGSELGTAAVRIAPY